MSWGESIEVHTCPLSRVPLLVSRTHLCTSMAKCVPDAWERCGCGHSQSVQNHEFQNKTHFGIQCWTLTDMYPVQAIFNVPAQMAWLGLLWHNCWQIGQLYFTGYYYAAGFILKATMFCTQVLLCIFLQVWHVWLAVQWAEPVSAQRHWVIYESSNCK